MSEDKIWLSTKSYTEETSTPDPNNMWDRASTDTTWSFGGLYLSNKRRGYEDLNYDSHKPYKIGDIVYVIVAVWSDGDSFGYDRGSNAEIFGVFSTYKEAEDCVTKLKKKRGYDVPWNGYFESLDYLEIIGGVLT